MKVFYNQNIVYQPSEILENVKLPCVMQYAKVSFVSRLIYILKLGNKTRIYPFGTFFPT